MLANYIQDLFYHCKLCKFVNIFSHFARPSTQHHMPSFGLRCTQMCV